MGFISREGREKEENDWVSCDVEVEERVEGLDFMSSEGKEKRRMFGFHVMRK